MRGDDVACLDLCCRTHDLTVFGQQTIMNTLKDITCLDTLGCASAILSELNGTRLALSFIMHLMKTRTVIREDSRSRSVADMQQSFQISNI